jgi:outer membrane biosynthesis protein TonB
LTLGAAKVTAPVPVKTTKLELPDVMKPLVTDSKVRLDLVICPKGNVKSLQGSAGSPALVDATLEQVKKWKFAPATIDGKPVQAVYPLEVHYSARR